MVAVKWYPPLHPVKYSNEGDQMCSHQGTFESAPVRRIPKSSDQDTSARPPRQIPPWWYYRHICTPQWAENPCVIVLNCASYRRIVSVVFWRCSVETRIYCLVRRNNWLSWLWWSGLISGVETTWQCHESALNREVCWNRKTASEIVVPLQFSVGGLY